MHHARYHARSPLATDWIACGARPSDRTVGKIPIVAEHLGDVTCCDCLRLLGYRPADVHPTMFSRRHVAIFYPKAAA